MDIRTAGDRFPGIGRYAYHLACALARQKNRGELILLYCPGLANTRFDTLSFAADVKIVAAGAPPLTAREQLLLPLQLRRLAPDVTHFPSWIMPYAAPRPFVLTVHDLIPLCLPAYYKPWQRRAYRASLAFSLRFAARVICPSQATRCNLESVFPGIGSRLSVIPEGVAESFRPCTKKESDRVRTKYSLPERYLLHVGSNKPHKNLPALLDAYARVGRAPELLLAGAHDPRLPEVRRRIELLGLANRVRLMGLVPEEDLPGLYGGAQAFVFPSTYEGFGLPPLEAMACGAPVACSDIPSLREAAGSAALFFDVCSPESIANALQRIIGDEELRAGLRASGLLRASELTWDLAAQKTLDVYRQAC